MSVNVQADMDQLCQSRAQSHLSTKLTSPSIYLLAIQSEVEMAINIQYHYQGMLIFVDVPPLGSGLGLGLGLGLGPCVSHLSTLSSSAHKTRSPLRLLQMTLPNNVTILAAVHCCETKIVSTKGLEHSHPNKNWMIRICYHGD